MAAFSRIIHHVPNYLILILKHDNAVLKHSHQPQTNRAPLECGETGDLHHGCATAKFATVRCYRVSLEQNVSSILINMYHEEVSPF